MKRGSVVLRRHNCQLGLETACQARKASAFIKLVRMRQRWKAQKSIEYRSRLIGGGDDADLTYRFFAPSKGSRKIRFDQLRTGAQMQQNPLRLFECVIEQQKSIFRSLESFDIRE